MDAPNEAYEVKKLDAYVLMMAEIRKLRIAEIINDYISRDPRSKISAGEAVEALIMLILTGDHTLYRVKSVLSELDLEVIFGRKGIKAEYFHDDRLGAVLDALHYVGLSQIFGSVSLQAIYIHHLDTSILSEDTTSISFEGVYEDSALVANGFSKDHRPDLKQVLFGITVTQDGGIPIIGRVTKGNQSDSTEVRIQLSLLEKYLPDVKDYLFVGDSKIMSGETIAAVKANNAHFLTLLPSTFSIKKELLSMDKPMNLLLKKQGKKGQMETYKGFSVTEDYEYLPGESTELKFLVVHSTVLNRKKRKTLENLVKKEKAELIKFVKKKEKREYYCEKDATVAREALM
ncbi:MAG: IS1634 family transposase, partial [Thermoplasmata archaeon]|nr:IS1634 family transposase [Thermoplasmata archaeon]